MSKPILQLSDPNTAEYSSDAVVNDLDITNDLKINSVLPVANQILGTSTINTLSWQIPFQVIAQYWITQYQDLNISNGHIVELEPGFIFNRGCEGVYTQIDSVANTITFLQNCTVRVQVTFNCNINGTRQNLQMEVLKNGAWTYSVYLEYSTAYMDFIQTFAANDVISIRNVRNTGTGPVYAGDQDYITITVLN